MTAIVERRRWLADYAMPLATGLVLLALTYAQLYLRPYVGFSYSAPSGEVTYIYAASSGLVSGDALVSIGPVSLSEYQADWRQRFFVGVRAGEVVPIVVERDGRQVTVLWVLPGPTIREFWERVFSNYGVGLIIYAAAVVTYLAVRPRDGRWRLMVAFFCITAIWMTASAVSATRVLGSAEILRTAIWLSVPIYWRLHWQFPVPFAFQPRDRWWGIVYAAAAGLAVLEWFHWLPDWPYQLALLAALAGCVLLLLAHAWRQPQHRSEIGRLAVLVGLILLPLASFAVAAVFAEVSAASVLAIPSLLALPFVYLAVGFRRQLSGLHWRVNQTLSRFAFFVALITIGLILIALASSSTADPSGALVVGLAAGLSTAIVTSSLQSPFERWFQRQFLGMRLPPDKVLNAYSTRIASSLTVESLAELLARDVLPSLLVREALLLQMDERGQAAPILALGMDQTALPGPDDRAALAAESGRYRAPEGSAGRPCPWVRVAFALRANEQLVGLLLLGRRDPDDYYDRAELDQIGTLAQQVAVVLSHIALTQQLRDLNQHTMSVSEAERASLARELHDGPMSRLSLQLQRLPPDTPTDARQGIQDVIDSLRRTAAGLRPPALDFGLHAALRSLALDLKARTGPETEIELDVPPSTVRYDPQVELQVYRIAQQAGHNAALHARARTITIMGELAAGWIDLTLVDDGRGFDTGETLELGRLLAQGHFGLAGMHERARAVGARLELQSPAGEGTRVRLRWEEAAK